jgi:hypothetical protein
MTTIQEWDERLVTYRIGRTELLINLNLLIACERVQPEDHIVF